MKSLLMRCCFWLLVIPQAACAADASQCMLRQSHAACAKQSAARPAPVHPRQRERMPSPPLVSVPKQSAPPVTPPPSTITTCDAGGCWGTDASRYQGGAGNAYLDKSGRLCQRNGAWMQCF